MHWLGNCGICFVPISLVSLIAALLWSSLACGQDCIDVLQDASWVSPICFGVVATIFYVLYVFDFFWPTHSPGTYCSFGDRDGGVGLAIVVVALLACCAGMVLKADWFPWMPFVLTTFLAPVLVAGVWQFLRPKNPLLLALRRSEDFAEREWYAEDLRVLELDEENFYRGAEAAFVIVAIATLVAWLLLVRYGAMSRYTYEEVWDDGYSDVEKEERFIVWACPGVAAAFFLAFAVILRLRIQLGDMYIRCPEIMKFKTEPRQHILDGEEQEEPSFPQNSNIMKHALSRESLAEEVDEATNLKRLQYLLNVVLCFVVVLFGTVYTSYLLVGKLRMFLLMVQVFLLLLLVGFVVFVFFTLPRLCAVMGQWLMSSKMVQMMKGAASSTWGRAFAFYCLCPLLPPFFLLCMTNQCVRRCRKLANTPTSDGELRKPTAKCHGDVDVCSEMSSDDDIQVAAGKYRFLTVRVRGCVHRACLWDWIPIVNRVYIIGFLTVAWALSSTLLNVLLAWLIKCLSQASMSLVVVSVWFIGIVLFLLPPVPGAPVYYFGGVLVSGKGVDDWGGIEGWTYGTVICIFVCFALKLSACAVQQKLIGNMLGSQLWVRRLVAVHKPEIRAIEKLLRRPGLSFGKVMILVGGPDWPTSVLAGILGLSLWQCELGTTPIIFYIVPLSLTGSFYYMRDAGEMWQRLADVMLLVTLFQTVCMWLVIGWFLQETFLNDYEELMRPLEKYIDLEWLDFREEEIQKSGRLKWAELPCFVKAFFVTGCVGVIFVGHSFYFFFDSCFTNLEVTGNIDELSLVGEEHSLIKSYGLLGLAVVGVCSVCWMAFFMYSSAATRERKISAALQVDRLEASWKEQRRKECAEAAPTPLKTTEREDNSRGAVDRSPMAARPQTGTRSECGDSPVDAADEQKQEKDDHAIQKEAGQKPICVLEPLEPLWDNEEQPEQRPPLQSKASDTSAPSDSDLAPEAERSTSKDTIDTLDAPRPTPLSRRASPPKKKTRRKSASEAPTSSESLKKPPSAASKSSSAHL